MESFIYLPAYKEYQAQWINLNAVESIYKLKDTSSEETSDARDVRSEERVCINYRSGKKQVYSDIWAKIILDYLGEPKFQELWLTISKRDEIS
jgi:general stress protein 26